MNNPQILYQINHQEQLIFVSDRWSKFALANDGPELIGEKILNRSLWDFITDSTTQELYRKIIQKVRKGHVVNLNLRCDSPGFRRLLSMTITLQGYNNVQFETHIIWMEKRNRQNIFQKDIQRSDDILVVCSWCNKINVGDEIWQEIEEAVSTLDLFECEYLPRISHGMCPSCYQAISEKY